MEIMLGDIKITLCLSIIFLYWGPLGSHTLRDYCFTVGVLESGWHIKSGICDLSILIGLKMTVMQKSQGQGAALFTNASSFWFFKQNGNNKHLRPDFPAEKVRQIHK